MHSPLKTTVKRIPTDSAEKEAPKPGLHRIALTGGPGGGKTETHL